MSTVKGSKQYSLKVVPHRPGRRALQVLLALIFVGAALAAAYFGGYWQGMGRQSNALAERDRLQIELTEAREELAQHRQQVANLAVASEVDQMASEEVRGEVIDLRRQIASLEADISFYRGLMSPSEDSNGLTLGEVTITETPVTGRFAFKIVVQQVATNHQVLSGVLNADVIGRSDGGVTRVPLYQLSSDIDTQDIKLRFKYFQNVEGELTLPEGFVAERLELAARSSGRTGDSVEKSFPWPVENL